MSNVRRLRRLNERLIAKRQSVLGELLSDFYMYLSREQRSPEEVREVFANANRKWVDYCKKEKLQPQAYDAFKAQVGAVWQKKLQESQKND